MARDVLVDLAAQHASLAQLIVDLPEERWHATTPCPGWDVADVVLHLAQTDEAAIASAEGRFPAGPDGTVLGDRVADVDELAERMVVEARSMTPDGVLARWATAAHRLRSVLASTPPDHRVQWVVGTFSARTLATTRLAETWIHTGDVAEALGVEVTVDDRIVHIARLAWRTVPYAFTRAGLDAPAPVGFDLVLPSGERCAFGLDDAVTVVRGTALDLCRVAGQRASAADTALTADGPAADDVLRLVRTFA